ncbi:MAG: prephenate dehydrogenase [Anaerolineae bacterium]|nr:prephenate dehydrogenase [Anaerolineae bacterium]
MGGSLGMALRQAHAVGEVVGVVRRPEAVAEAIEMGAVDRATMNGPAAVAEADVVVLATPVRTIIRQIAELGPHMRPGTVLTDMGSTKRAICQAMEALPRGVQPVGSHPMCGKERSGIAAAEPGLFRDRIWVVSPLDRSSPEAVQTVEALGRIVGSRIIHLDPARHDQLVAAVSHLPYLLSCGLVATVDALGQYDPEVWTVAASGFRDTSRLAASDVRMMLDILLTNREAVLAMVERFEADIRALADRLRHGDEAGLAVRLEQIRGIRQEHSPR